MASTCQRAAVVGGLNFQEKSTTYSVALVKHIIGGTPAPAAARVQSVQVDEESAGQRLDNFLIRHLKGVPKTHVYRIIRSGEVRVNKGRASADTRLEAGDVVRLPPVRTSVRAEAKAMEVKRGGASSTVGGAAPARQFPLLLILGVREARAIAGRVLSR